MWSIVQGKPQGDSDAQVEEWDAWRRSRAALGRNTIASVLLVRQNFLTPVLVNESALKSVGLTIAGEGEGNEVSVLELDKHPDQSHVEYHPLHQHPHEGRQEEVVQQDSHCLATNL